MKRRKVNKKDLIDGNAGMLFGNYLCLLQKKPLHIEIKLLVKFNEIRINSDKSFDSKLYMKFIKFIYTVC